MKRLKKLAISLLSLAMVFSMFTTAFAVGETGSITIRDSATVSVAGKTFNAYQILNVETYTNDNVVYTVPAAMKSFYTGRYKLTGEEADFDYQVVEKIRTEADMYDFAAAALAAAKENVGVTHSSKIAGERDTSVTIDNLPLGYYVVEDTGATKPVSALILDTTNPNVTVTIKADQPPIDKNINGDIDTDNTTTGKVKNNTASIGDSVPFIVTSKVPDMTGYKNYWFVVNDTLSKGLTFNNDVAITIGTETLVKDQDYTVTSKNADDTTAVEIVFKNFIRYKDREGAEINITYSATVNQNAVIGDAGNPNEVKLIYSNNPQEDNDGDKPEPNDPHGETPPVTTRTFVTEVEIIKVDNAGNRLTGAEFQLAGTKLNTVLVTRDVFTKDENGTYWKLKDGTYTTDDPATEGMDQSKYESTTTRYSKNTQTTPITQTETVNVTGTVGDDGVLKFTGLAAGDYTITEIKAPNGYNLLKNPIGVTIGFIAPENATANGTWSYTWLGDNDNHSNQVTVVNQSGTELPSTGGMGTTLFYVVGGLLVAGAAVMLVTKKRMSNR